jgi:hypothetical protein
VRENRVLRKLCGPKTQKGGGKTLHIAALYVLHPSINTVRDFQSRKMR